MYIIPEEGFVSSGGFKIHYLRWRGEGQKLVLLHSFGMDAHSFDDFSNAVKGDFDVLALDLLDLGDSEKPGRDISLREHADVIRGAYSQLGYAPNVIIGHSIGGILGTVLAAEYPLDVEGLVLVDIGPMPKDRPRTSRPEPPESFTDEAEVRAYLKVRYTVPGPEFIENRLKHAFVKGEDGRYRFKYNGASIRGHIDEDLWPYVERLSSPTLLMLGGMNTIVPAETVEKMKHTIPGLQIVTVEGATHAIPQDQPKTFEAEIRTFVASLK
jgi:pimeloyl-ACP methyl ester carboxylesterase